MIGMLFIRALGLAVAVVLAACEAIPELAFEDDAGDAGVLSAPPDAALAGDLAGDGEARAPVDAEPIAPESDDASHAEDASPPPPPHACPSAVPSGATVCCGVVPCVGNKCAADCAECAACVGRACCAGSNGKTVTCAASVAACPHGKD